VLPKPKTLPEQQIHLIVKTLPDPRRYQISKASGRRNYKSRFREKCRLHFPLPIDKDQKISKLYQSGGWIGPKRGKLAPGEVLAATA